MKRSTFFFILSAFAAVMLFSSSVSFGHNRYDNYPETVFRYKTIDGQPLMDSLHIWKGYSESYDSKTAQFVMKINNVISRYDDATLPNSYRIQSIDIPEGIKVVGRLAFAETCDHKGRYLNKVRLPESLETIEAAAFIECSNLLEIDIPEGVKVIELSAFRGCESLRKVNFAKKACLKCIGGFAFSGCKSLVGITIPKSVSDIGPAAFGGCSIQRFYGKFASKNGTYLHRGDTLIAVNEELIRKEQIPEGINYIGAAYAGSALRHFIIPDGYQEIPDNAFEECENLETVKIPEGVTKIGYSAFEECENLQSVKIPEGVTKIGSHAFSQCHSLESVSFPSSLDSIGACAFSHCAVSEIVIPEGVIGIGEAAFSSCQHLKHIVLPRSLKLIDYLFEHCEALEEVTIPEGVESLILAFNGCTSLKNVHLPSTMKKMHGAFRGCSALEEINLPEKLENFSFAFGFCSSLKKVNLPENLHEISENAFEGCTNLTEIIIPSSVTKIEPIAFYDCSSLEKVIFKGNNITKFGERCFSGCSSLKNIVFPEGLKTIENRAFEKAGLQRAKLPLSLETIEYQAFCSSGLKEIEFSEKIDTIQRWTFARCNIESLFIPSNIKRIGEKAFAECKSLKEVYIQGEYTDIEPDAFRSCDNLAEVSGNANIDKLMAAKIFYGTKAEKKYNEFQKELREFLKQQKDEDAVKKFNSIFCKYNNELNSKIDKSEYKAIFDICERILDESKILSFTLDPYPEKLKAVLINRASSYIDLYFPDEHGEGYSDNFTTYAKAMANEAKVIKRYGEQLIRMFPEEEHGYFCAGFGNGCLGNVDVSVRYFMQCMNHDESQSYICCKNAAAVCGNYGRYEKAIYYYKEALKYARTKEEKQEISSKIIEIQKELDR